jgi:hypothetical protein
VLKSTLDSIAICFNCSSVASLGLTPNLLATSFTLATVFSCASNAFSPSVKGFSIPITCGTKSFVLSLYSFKFSVTLFLGSGSYLGFS